MRSALRSSLWLFLALKKSLVSQECLRTQKQAAASISICHHSVCLCSSHSGLDHAGGIALALPGSSPHFLPRRDFPKLLKYTTC